MRKCVWELAAAALGVCSLSAWAVPVADYQDAFQVAGGPAPGWSYLWNAGTPLGDSDDYVPLSIDNGRYETQANGAYPDAAPGSFLSAGSGVADPVLFPPNPNIPPLPLTYLRPGQGPTQPGAGGIERAAVAGYTFSAADVAAGGNEAFFTDFYFAVSATALDGMTARVYRREASATTDTLLLDFIFPAEFVFYTALDPDPIPLGTVAAGDSIYVAIGSFLTDSYGAAPGDEMRLDFTISLFPEPGVLASPAALAALGLIRRRTRGR